jgi:DNA-binding response OmpR family regulator
LADRIGLFLGAKGYRVDRASDGNEALQKIRVTLPDLVILDAVLPKMSGFQIARLIKFDQRCNEVSILMLTILDQPADKERAKTVGIDCYLTKPFTDEDLLEAVKKLLV